jgi:effector-binding domain-containing protein
MTFQNRILITALLLFIQVNAMAIEEPSYEVIETYEEFEVRRYQPYLLAEVDVSGGINSAGNKAFRILAGYIFGDNEAATEMVMTAPVESRSRNQGEKMAMTAPVTSTKKDGDEMTTVAFVMEQKYSIETLPVPNDQRIQVREVPERIVAVRRYSGRWTDAKYQRNLQLLVEALSNESLKVVGEAVLARYNSPFSLPMMRRNEVMFEIKASDSNAI